MGFGAVEFWDMKAPSPWATGTKKASVRWATGAGGLGAGGAADVLAGRVAGDVA